MWVIERYRHSLLEFWGGRNNDGRENRWEDKFTDAVRFADAESASRVLADLCDGVGRVAEHAWIKADLAKAKTSD